MRKQLTVLTITLTVLFLAEHAHIFAQEKPAQFSDRERLVEALNNNPEKVVAALETIVSQAQADALENTLFPKPSEDEQKALLTGIKLRLKRMGLDNADTLVQAVDERISELAETAAEAPRF